MAHKINDESCSACGACAEVCPEAAIAYNPAKCCYIINPEKCIDCGACKDGCGSGAAQPGS